MVSCGERVSEYHLTVLLQDKGRVGNRRGAYGTVEQKSRKSREVLVQILRPRARYTGDDDYNKQQWVDFAPIWR